MAAYLSGLGFLLVAAISGAAHGALMSSQEFVVQSKDGTGIRGVVDGRAVKPRVVVIMVSGTGLFDRDVKFGLSNTPRDLLFKDLSSRFGRRNMSVVRYDRRGVLHGAKGEAALNRIETATVTVKNQSDDLRAVYDWTLSANGLGARCVILFGHSEGMRHIAGIAESGAPAPLLVVGVGAPMRGPADILRWQMAERGVYSLRLMDANGDGRITEVEIEANWHLTPASSFAAFKNGPRPRRTLTESDLQRIGRAQFLTYARARAAAHAMDDLAPFPDARAPVARASWWKTWFTDYRPIALRLATWPSQVSLHYGEIDSQTPPTLEVPAARKALGNRIIVQIHAARGHSLGKNALLGPIDENVAESIADEISSATRDCPR